jgi:glycogen debranching enzyme
MTGTGNGDMAAAARQHMSGQAMNEASFAADFHIPAPTTLDRDSISRLKHGETFGVFDEFGDIVGFKGNSDGVYHRDTRHLSHFEFRLEGGRPLLLSSSIQHDNAALAVDLSNPDFRDGGRIVVAKDRIHLQRLKFIWNEAVYERISITNYTDTAVRLRPSFVFNADFADLFEARGQERSRMADSEPEVFTGAEVAFRCSGLDGVERRSVLSFFPQPEHLEIRSAFYDLVVPALSQALLFIRVACGEEAPGEWSDVAFIVALIQSRRALNLAMARAPTLSSSSSRLETMLTRSHADLSMLVTDTPHGPYPYAGIPWFSTTFGRDGLITALFALWFDPALAKGVLGYLAANQATETDPFSDAEPGKILHETRAGEMANLREIPFGKYYGSIDSTPLFVFVAGEYWRRTGDLAFLVEIWPAIRAALAWIEIYGDRDGDGFVEYSRQRDTGLVNQGWKDSHDSVFHADGRMAHGPIALCEVQAYVYGAWRAGAAIAGALGKVDGPLYKARADALRVRFEAAFWLADEGVYALALDGAKAPCRVVTSNAGHTLLTGLASPERARQLANRLMGGECFSGWGIRTLASTEKRYNPMSYHNGSVWPHDNAIIALGLARYGLKAPVSRIFEGLAAAADSIPLARLPELFCGFGRTKHKGPTKYPVACAPQAWSAATPLALIAASLGLTLDHATQTVRLDRPTLPGFVDRLSIRKLVLGSAWLDLDIARHRDDVAVSVVRREGDVHVSIDY